MFLHFQLHTVHQEPSGLCGSVCSVVCFQLHTVHQEPSSSYSNSFKTPFRLFQLHTVHQEHDSENYAKFQRSSIFQLHTVHQEPSKSCHDTDKKPSFNSTRYIRNWVWVGWQGLFTILSTPHGTLGTNCAEEELEEAREWLSTPHGTLGTLEQRGLRTGYSNFLKYFQLHTVHQEPQTTTLTKTRHINNFVKRVPLSNEVNFPKSEIMQS